MQIKSHVIVCKLQFQGGLYAINMLLKLYIIFLNILMISNEKTQNYKFVDTIESYNFYIKDIFI